MASLPPTKIISSTRVHPRQAQTFLSDFLEETNDVIDVSLSNLRRINQALQGIHVPRPQELVIAGTKPAQHTKPPTEGEAVAAKNIGQDEEIDEDREELGVRDDPNTQPTADVNLVPVSTTDKKVVRKAEKKTRRKEDKKNRAEQKKEKKRDQDK